jgi:hypothetical protein
VQCPRLANQLGAKNLPGMGLFSSKPLKKQKSNDWHGYRYVYIKEVKKPVRDHRKIKSLLALMPDHRLLTGTVLRFFSFLGALRHG